ncbi:MAG: haloalkane dehalogenase, partial [Myxococcota bacterium]
MSLHARYTLPILFTTTLLAVACGDSSDEDASDDPVQTSLACDAEPELWTTPAGVEFVRTPDSCFEGLSEWPYEAKYVELDGLRQAYVDEGPRDGQVVLLLHGQPSWSYLYRKMIPTLVAAGHRVLAIDHIGMGRSDKPTDVDFYTYLGHIDRLERFIDELQLRDITLFVQDWGSLIGLRVAGTHPEWFARIAVGNGTLPVLPEGMLPFGPVQEPDIEDASLPSPYAGIPPQQMSFYADDGCTLLGSEGTLGFNDWMAYAMKSPTFRASETLESLTWFDLTGDEEAAYDAPFPSRIYMAGPRKFPSIILDVPGQTAQAWEGLGQFDKPFVTIWASNDAGNLGGCQTQQDLIDHVPGSFGEPHTRLPQSSHFLQDDQGQQIAQRLVRFMDDTNDLTRGAQYCEILLVSMRDGALEAEVWGTQGVSTCPLEQWDALDPEQIKQDTGALFVQMNGPRLWLPNRTSAKISNPAQRSFGDLRMNRMAKLQLPPGQNGVEPYTTQPVLRDTIYRFEAGEEVYELTSPT